LSSVVTIVESECCCPNCVQGTHPNEQPNGLGSSSFFDTASSQGMGSLFSGYVWDKTTITYAFPDSSSDYKAGYMFNEPFEGFNALNAVQKSAFLDIIEHVQSFTNLTFVEGAHDTAMIRIAESSVPSVAWAYYPGRGRESGDIWLSSGYEKVDDPYVGSYAYVAMMHEVGHALGLKHTFGTENGYAPVADAFDSMNHTLMSYSSHVNSSINFYGNEKGGYAQSFMGLDIISLQTLYGANTNYNGGNTTYSWNPNTGEMSINGVGQGAPIENRIFSTLWDGGGYDIYDLSNYSTDMRISLVAGDGSIFNTAQLAKLNSYEQYSKGEAAVYANYNITNAMQVGDYLGSLIDEARGGRGNDILIGNQLSNVLHGNDGNDVLYGNQGNDILVGGYGNDTINGGEGFDIAIFQNTAQNSTLDIRDDGTIVILYDQTYNQYDTFTDVERVLFSDRKLAFDVDGNAGQAYRLYQAAFDRTPDEQGLGFWIAAIDGGMQLEDVSEKFVQSAEFMALTGQNATSDVFVNAMYQNVLQRDADLGGLEYWKQQMDSGMDRADILLHFSESAENITITSHAVGSGIWFV
jgi:Ca2+-binding RTX toxin-like protein